jgi:DNA-binding CsgD family transcriptional regulator
MSLAVNWSEISPRGMAIARQIGTRLAEGYTPNEIARELQTSSSSILRLIAELQAELKRLVP